MLWAVEAIGERMQHVWGGRDTHPEPAIIWSVIHCVCVCVCVCVLALLILNKALTSRTGSGL